MTDADTPSGGPPTPRRRTPSIVVPPGETVAVYVAPPKVRRGGERSRGRTYAVAFALFVILSVAGYVGFRSYIYGDDAPPVPVLDELGG